MQFYATPAVFRAETGGELEADNVPGPMREQGLFRGFYCLSLPVTDLEERNYTLEIGEDRELTYFLTMEEVAAP